MNNVFFACLRKELREHRYQLIFIAALIPALHVFIGLYFESIFISKYNFIEKTTLACLCAAIFVSFFMGLGSAPLFDKDEGAFCEATREMLESGNYLMTYLNYEPRYDKPILIYWFQALSAKLLGLNEFALRLPSAIAAAAWALVMYRFTRHTFDVRKAFLATFLMVTAVQVTIIGKAAIADAVLNCFIAITMFGIWRYIESGRWRDEENRDHTYEAHWRLEVEGPAKISVTAGQFDVWKIVGRRFTRGDAFKPSRLREIRNWYYAPAVGHYVREERQYKGRRADRDKELLAVIPPVAHLNASAQTTMHTHFQKALEEQQSGKALRWTLADQALSGTTTPVATFKIDSGGYCRQYVQRLNRSGEERAFYGLACRTDAGRWEVPRR